ncbi:MAG TPA: Wzz/FepE/Etk N-terminal domain-containing protein [Acidobacteriaceae bacterium]
MPTDTQVPQRQEPTHSVPAGAQPGDDMSLLDLLIVLAERRSLILKITAACVILALITVFVVPVRYTATTTLLPPQQNSSLSAALSTQLGSLGSMAMLAGGGLGMLKNPNDMYVGMLKSETVEDAVIDKFGLMREYRKRHLSDTRKKLESYVSIDGDKKDGLIHLSMEDHDAQRAADLANGYVDAFRHLSAGLAITEAAQRRKFFGDQLEQAKDQLAGAEEALKQTEQTTGLIQLDSQARALIESAASLRAQITAKEVQIHAMSTYATGDNAQLMQAQQELDSMRTELARLGGSEDNPDSLIVPKGKVPEAGLEYVRKLRDVKYYETIFEILARQFELAKLDEAKEGALVQVVDPALKPDRKSFPRRGLIVIVAFFVGLFLGVLAALTQAGLAQLRAHPESGAKLALLREILRRKRSPAS